MTEQQEMKQETEAIQGLAEKTVVADPTFTQSDVDRMVTKALETREGKLKQEQKAEQERLETEILKEKEQYKELYERSELEKSRSNLERKTEKYLRENSLSEVSDFFTYDTTTLDGRIEFANKINALVASKSAAKSTAIVEERLETPAPVASSAVNTDWMHKDPNDMSKEELEAVEASLGMTRQKFDRR